MFDNNVIKHKFNDIFNINDIILKKTRFCLNKNEKILVRKKALMYISER